MPALIELDEALVADAMRVTGQVTGQAAVEEALRKHIRALEQMQAIEDLHGIGWEGPSLDELRGGGRDPR